MAGEKTRGKGGEETQIQGTSSVSLKKSEGSTLEEGNVEQKELDVHKFQEKDVNYRRELDLDASSIFSKITLYWLSRIVLIGYKRRLEPSDIWYLRENEDAKTLSDRFDEAFDRFRSEGVSHDKILWKILFHCFRKDLIVSFLLHFAYAALRFAGPFLLNKLVEFVEGGTDKPDYYGYGLAIGLGASQAVATLCFALSDYIAMSVGLRMRSMLSSAAFKQLLEIDPVGRQNTSQGQAVSLVSTDAQITLEIMRQFNRTIIAPFLLVAGVAYIYALIGPSCLAGISVLIVFVPMTIWFGKLQLRVFKKKMKRTDSRLKYVKEVLQGIKIIKLYAWETPSVKRLEDLRTSEIKALRKAMYIRATTVPLSLVVPNIAAVLTFSVYLTIHGSISAAEAFTVVSLFVIIRTPFVTLPIAINLISQGIVAYKRLGKFLYLPKLKKHMSNEDPGVDPGSKSLTKTFSVKRADFQWPAASEHKEQPKVISSKKRSSKFSFLQRSGNKSKPNMTKPETSSNLEAFSLQDINLDLHPGKIVAVVGKVASGKSTLCAAILGELNPSTGEVDKLPSIAFCDQEPFIMNATVRDNILFNREFDYDRYQQTLDACALESDLEIFPAGDQTEIGERGVTLSGGQKARIALARAVYADLDVYLFDDPLSAVDAHVANHLFNRVISNGEDSILRGKTKLFITNQTHYLNRVDNIIVMQEGKIVQYGTYDTLMKEENSPLVILMKDLIQTSNKISKNEVAEPQNIKKKSTLTNQKTTISKLALRKDNKENKGKGKLTSIETRKKGTIDFSVFRAYWSAASDGSIFVVVAVLGLFFLAEAIFLAIDTWLALWTQGDTNDSTERFIGIYWAITMAFMLSVLLRSLAWATFAVHAADVLYKRMNSRVIQFPMSFFWKNPMGIVLNRLSQDTNAIDEFLNLTWQWFLMTTIRVVGILIFISIVAPVFCAALLPIVLVYLGVRQYFRATAREMQRIESISRSPVFNHLAETLNGATTIRAFSLQNQWLETAYQRIEWAHRAKFAAEVVQLWMSQRLEWLGAFILFMAGVSVIVSKDTIGAGFAGLALSYALNVTINLNISVKLSTQLEAQMNAVERVVEYTKLPIEDGLMKGKEPSKTKVEPEQLEQGSGNPIPDNWPSNGTIEFENVSLRYREDLKPALDSASLVIKAGTSCGLCGRTGSGKSTIMIALFRIVDIFSGRILIDGIDIMRMSKQRLRSSLTLIPQDPVLFIGTIRNNLDPFSRYSDEVLWRALEHAHLKETIEGLPGKLGAPVSENGTNFSVGERALICLARALVRKSKVVLLDEATASVDTTTDSKIQTTIRTEFKGMTLVVIAHRLQTIIDSDQIAVLGDGKILESGHPHELLQNSNSNFSAMVSETGKESEKSLKKLAEKAFVSKDNDSIAAVN